jgi:hypothetical protein
LNPRSISHSESRLPITQSVGRYVPPPGNIILIRSRSILLLLLKSTDANFIVFAVKWPTFEPTNYRTSMDASPLTITSLMRLTDNIRRKCSNHILLYCSLKTGYYCLNCLLSIIAKRHSSHIGDKVELLNTKTLIRMFNTSCNASKSEIISWACIFLSTSLRIISIKPTKYRTQSSTGQQWC